MKSNIFKKAHKLTKEIIRKGDNYRATFKLCLSFVYSQIKKGVVKMVEIIIGTEKQIAYATKKREQEIAKIKTKIEKCGHIGSVAKKIPVMRQYIQLLQSMNNARDILASMEMSHELAIKKFLK